LGPQIIYIKRETNKPSIQFIFNDTDGYTEQFNKIGKINNPSMITDLTTKKERNVLIINTIKKLTDRKILVLSDRREHCELIDAQLKLLGIRSGLYLGGMKTNERDLSVNCQVIIGTYQASGEGFDVPELDTLVLATPKSDVQQAVGRILRQKNKNEPLVIDIVDSFSIFRAQYYKRRKFYKSSQWLFKTAIDN
jgi:superfamily II DNA or RNA helicase